MPQDEAQIRSGRDLDVERQRTAFAIRTLKNAINIDETASSKTSRKVATLENVAQQYPQPFFKDLFPHYDFQSLTHFIRNSIVFPQTVVH